MTCTPQLALELMPMQANQAPAAALTLGTPALPRLLEYRRCRHLSLVQHEQTREQPLPFPSFSHFRDGRTRFSNVVQKLQPNWPGRVPWILREGPTSSCTHTRAVVLDRSGAGLLMILGLCPWQTKPVSRHKRNLSKYQSCQIWVSGVAAADGQFYHAVAAEIVNTKN
ncbi:hypothetical protein L209DRAFT_313285 [Thermothelomyces heterothallicus CBS 203.75]